MLEIEYNYPLYRPPSEANSLIFQVTLGCSFNKCSFCNMYRTKEYQERPCEEIKAEIDLASNAFPQANRVFLGDGDALNLPTDRLILIIGYLRSKFPSGFLFQLSIVRLAQCSILTHWQILLFV